MVVKDDDFCQADENSKPPCGYTCALMKVFAVHRILKYQHTIILSRQKISAQIALCIVKCPTPIYPSATYCVVCPLAQHPRINTLGQPPSSSDSMVQSIACFTSVVKTMRFSVKEYLFNGKDPCVRIPEMTQFAKQRFQTLYAAKSSTGAL